MMEIPLRLDIFSLLILLGIFQGLFLSFFFLNKKARSKPSNLFFGLFIIVLSIVILEIWLNYTGYMARILVFENFSEPLNYSIAPLIYLYIRAALGRKWNKSGYWHFAPFVFYLFYMVFFYIQPLDVKYNSYIWAYHPELDYLPTSSSISQDPIGLRELINELILLHFLTYALLSLLVVYKQTKLLNENFLKIRNSSLKWLRNMVLHFIVIIVLFVFVKTYFGRDLGDYFIASYVALIMYITSFHVIKSSLFFTHKIDESTKYQKSALSEERKDEILQKIEIAFDRDKYHLNNLASLSELAKAIKESQHYVSQTINERLNKNFYELLAVRRIAEAEKMLKDPINSKMTVEEIAETVGYNSKAAFNNAFKKITGVTPSVYKKDRGGV